jgi:predicted methyltransferase|tara:strand:+ start:840 stop:1631 length:792 start_codon:yes stop_codon:yes gene_type:complete
MKKLFIFFSFVFLLYSKSIFADALDVAIKNIDRTPENMQRDQYRNPKATLNFFGIKPNMSVIELWPSRGWYSEILNPFLDSEGDFIGAGFDPNYASWTPKAIKRNTKIRANSKTLSGMQMIILPLNNNPLTEKESVDMVLTFRNLHNWLKAEILMDVFHKSYAALKPGGIFGVVEHRALANASLENMKKSGYVTEELAIEYAKKAGFILVAKSEINANPKDGTIHPKGVWTLPPSLRLGEEEKAKYIAIGESDRMTLKFMKPN